MANGNADVTAEVKKAMSAGEFASAADVGARLLKTHSRNTLLSVMTSVAEIHAKRFSRAGARLKRLIADVSPRDQYFAPILQNLHEYARITGDFSAVVQVLESKRQKQNAHPIYSEAIANLVLERLNRQGMARLYSKDIFHAIELLEKLPADYPRTREAKEVLARLYVHCEVTDKAFSLLTELVAANPDDRALRLFQLSALAISGEVEAAKKCALSLIDDYTDIGPRPYLVLCYLSPLSLPENSEQVLEAYLADTRNPVIDRFQAAFALGAMAESRNDMKTAFSRYQTGHAISAAIAPYDINKDLTSFERIRALLNQTVQHGEPRSIHTDEAPTPIFIVGMPRSASTLAESILGAHADVHGAGEIGDFANIVWEATGVKDVADQMAKLGKAEIHEIRRRYLAALRGYAPDARFVIDKNLGNLTRVGLIRMIFPTAPIVYMRRNPVATCVSIYTTPFVNSMRYADNLDDLAAYYRAAEELMTEFVDTDKHNTVFELEYETLVAEPETVGRALFTHCGINWDSSCLEFYRSEKVSRTASMLQVRRPLNSDSVAKWRRFEPYIGPLMMLDDDHGAVQKMRAS